MDDKSASKEERSLAAETVGILQRYAEYDELPIPTVREFKDEIQVIIDQSKRLPAHEKENSLCQALHSTIEQDLSMAVVGVDERKPTLIEQLQRLSSLVGEEWKQPYAALLSQIMECQDKFINVTKLEELCYSLRRICQSLPEPRSSLTNIAGVRTHHFRILVVEDSEEWRRDVEGAIDRVKKRLGEDFTIEKYFADNLEDALKIVSEEKGKVVPQDIDTDDEQVQTIAVCDMGLPKNKRHAEEIRARLSTPARENGFQLLEHLREYTVNIPVVILTTPQNDYEDHLRATRFGVGDNEIIYKFQENLTELEDALLKIIRRNNQFYHIKLRLSDRAVLIDKVKIDLPETRFKTFYALCQLSAASKYPRKIFTVDEIFDQLSHTFNEFSYKRQPQDDFERAKVLARTRKRDWWTAGTDQDLANYIHIWANKKRAAGGNLRKALNEFKDTLGWGWSKALQLIERYAQEKNPRHRIDQNNKAEIIAAIDEFFGGLDLQDKVDDNRCKNISDHIYEIRNSIASDFNKLGRHVFPENDIVISRKFIDDQGNEVHGYRVKGTFELVNEDESNNRPGVLPNSRYYKPVRVLVVENESSFQIEIRKCLESAQFEVIVVTNLEDAIDEIKSGTSFEILCLDMHIPATRAQYEENPSTGHYGNGLKVLEHLRKSGRNAQVIVPTDYIDQDVLRKKVAHLNVVPVRNFVSKGISRENGSWEGRLLSIAHKLRQEIWDEMILPDWNTAPVLTIRLEKGTNLEIGELNLSVNGQDVKYRKSLKSRMLALLLSKPREWIKDEDLAQWIYGKSAEMKEVKNQLKMLRREIHKSIHKEWLGKSDKEPSEWPKQILKTEEGRTILCVYVETSPHRTS
jgi:CheY-like chemotaxis protein